MAIEQNAQFLSSCVLRCSWLVPKCAGTDDSCCHLCLHLPRLVYCSALHVAEGWPFSHHWRDAPACLWVKLNHHSLFYSSFLTAFVQRNSSFNLLGGRKEGEQIYPCEECSHLSVAQVKKGNCNTLCHHHKVVVHIYTDNLFPLHALHTHTQGYGHIANVTPHIKLYL